MLVCRLGCRLFPGVGYRLNYCVKCQQIKKDDSGVGTSHYRVNGGLWVLGGPIGSITFCTRFLKPQLDMAGWKAKKLTAGLERASIWIATYTVYGILHRLLVVVITKKGRSNPKWAGKGNLNVGINTFDQKTSKSIPNSVCVGRYLCKYRRICT